SVPAGVEPPARKGGTGVDYETDWARTFPARWARVLILEGLIRPSVAGLARPERRGVDRLADLPAQHPPPLVVVAANHPGRLDAPLLLTWIPEPWRRQVFVGAAADYFFTNRVTSALSALALNAVPIERTGVSRRSVGQAEHLLAEGWSLVLF